MFNDICDDMGGCDGDTDYVDNDNPIRNMGQTLYLTNRTDWGDYKLQIVDHLYPTLYPGPANLPTVKYFLLISDDPIRPDCNYKLLLPGCCHNCLSHQFHVMI